MNDLLRGWPTISLVAGFLVGTTTVKRIIAALPTYTAVITTIDQPTNNGYVAEVSNLVIRTQCQRFWKIAQAAIPVTIALIAQLYIWRHGSAYSVGLSAERHASPFTGWFMTFCLFVPWLSLVALVMATFRVWLLRPSILHTKDAPIKFGSQSRMLLARPKVDIVDRHRPRKHNSSSDA